MATITFDTNAFIKHLVNAGMPEGQAEALAEEQTNPLHRRAGRA
ncbi:MAG: hypothetical protein FD149_2700 [Rhodospirillaceae bacterium]|nr:MAG: hypothetical protein FD149_2700 [Rhodospirillaceae bacterium]